MAHPIGLPGARLQRKIGIGDLGAGERHHVGDARRDGLPGLLGRQRRADPEHGDVGVLRFTAAVCSRSHATGIGGDGNT